MKKFKTESAEVKITEGKAEIKLKLKPTEEIKGKVLVTGKAGESTKCEPPKGDLPPYEAPKPKPGILYITDPEGKQIQMPKSVRLQVCILLAIGMEEKSIIHSLSLTRYQWTDGLYWYKNKGYKQKAEEYLKNI
jgi:hypothetical protein